jgi:nucleoid DNA-binding protein
MPIMAKAPGKKPPSKTEITKNIADATGLSKKQVTAVLEALTEEIRRSLGARGPGVFALPGLVKIEKRKVPAQPLRKGVQVRNPRTGDVTIKDIPAKPPSVKVKVRPLKALKAMVM